MSTGGGAQGGGGIPQDIQSIIYKLQENMNFVRSDLANVANRAQGQMNCPEVQSSCVSPMLFFLAIGLQLFFIVEYMVYSQCQSNGLYGEPGGVYKAPGV
uniref:Uncharacterized protein n=1 Tax=Magallana gigas TaxID=29159 RepID=K1PHL6_MAGGI